MKTKQRNKLIHKIIFYGNKKVYNFLTKLVGIRLLIIERSDVNFINIITYNYYARKCIAAQLLFH